MTHISARHFVNKGWALTFDNLSAFFRIACIPIIITLLTMHFLPYAGLSSPWEMATEKVINLVVGIFFMVQWYRYVVNQEPVTKIVKFCFGATEFRLLLLFFFVAAFPHLWLLVHVQTHFGQNSYLFLSIHEYHALLDSIGIWSLVVFVFYVLAIRFLLMFPAVSTGAAIDPLASWNATRGHWWLFIRAFLLIGVWFIVLSFGILALFDFIESALKFLAERLPAIKYFVGFLLNEDIYQYIIYFCGVVYQYFLWAWILTVPGLFYRELVLKKK